MTGNLVQEDLYHNILDVNPYQQSISEIRPGYRQHRRNNVDIIDREIKNILESAH